jgi:hypothetical protein
VAESRTKLAETRLVQELTEQKNQELRRELSRLLSLDERQRHVEAAVMRVQEADFVTVVTGVELASGTAARANH